MPLFRVLCNLTAPTGVAAVMLAIVVHPPWRSAFFLDAMGSL